eukprot:scaffold16616_cov105-Phaeocystis_antarctica.AAC.1
MSLLRAVGEGVLAWTVDGLGLGLGLGSGLALALGLVVCIMSLREVTEKPMIITHILGGELVFSKKSEGVVQPCASTLTAPTLDLGDLELGALEFGA